MTKLSILTLPELLKLLGFKDEAEWNKNKLFMDYKDNEEIQADGTTNYAEYFKRTHDYSHTEHEKKIKEVNELTHYKVFHNGKHIESIYKEITDLKNIINNFVIDINKKMKTLQDENVVLVDKVKFLSMMTLPGSSLVENHDYSRFPGTMPGQSLIEKSKFYI